MINPNIWYHQLDNEDYYSAMAKLAKNKFFKGIFNLKILDFGCGLGQNTAEIKNAIRYDPYKELSNDKIKIIHNLNEIENDFDVVLCVGVLEFVKSPLETLKEIHSKLKPGGRFILVLGNQISKSREVKKEFEPSGCLFRWNFKSINNLLLKAGFKVIENKTISRGGESKLLWLSKINFSLYEFLTKFLGLFHYHFKRYHIISEKL